MSISKSLVWDSEKGEFVKALPVKVEKKSGVSEAKAMAALKNHSEAEKRRRERINLHLATLRGLVPCNEKMDKATLLAEVIHQLKQLKKNAAEAAKDFLIPMDTDEVTVEQHDEDGGVGDRISSFRASLCCDYRPELLSDTRKALSALNLNLVNAEVSTLAGRVKNTFIFSISKERNGDDPYARNLLVSSVREALNLILDKVSTLSEYSPRTTLPNKKRRVLYFDSSSSSS